LNPSFSPDGSKIVFTSDLYGGQAIFIMNADGSNQTQLTSNQLNQYPTFSPDGSKIIFTSSREGNYGIFIMNVDGSNQTQLTFSSGPNTYPKYSPDGSKIVFTSLREGNYEIFIMNADGSGETQLTFNTAWDYSPSFSPNGTNIVYHSNLLGDFDIFVMNTDGSGITQLTDNPTEDSLPSFSPDGSKIIFSSNRDGDFEIFVGELSVLKLPPVAVPGGPSDCVVGTRCWFIGSASYDPDGSIVSYDWDFGDGNTSTGVAPSNTYAALGNYTVSLTVTDNDGLTDITQTFAIVELLPPYTLEWDGYDYDSVSEVTVTLNGQVVAILPPTRTPGNNNAWVTFSVDISPFVVDGVNDLTFTQNIYSSASRNVQVTDSNGVVVFSDGPARRIVQPDQPSTTYTFELSINEAMTANP
jgi:Tol biopolymer transport system component